MGRASQAWVRVPPSDRAGGEPQSWAGQHPGGWGLSSSCSLVPIQPPEPVLGVFLGRGCPGEGHGLTQAVVFACFLCRVLTELVSKMRDMQMDKSELGCLRAIVLFNPGTAFLAWPAVRPRAREPTRAAD